MSGRFRNRFSCASSTIESRYRKVLVSPGGKFQSIGVTGKRTGSSSPKSMLRWFVHYFKIVENRQFGSGKAAPIATLTGSIFAACCFSYCVKTGLGCDWPKAQTHGRSMTRMNVLGKRTRTYGVAFGLPPVSNTCTEPYLSSTGFSFTASPTATICRSSGTIYLRATRCTCSAVTAVILAGYASQ
jgi:hypothetical protein